MIDVQTLTEEGLARVDAVERRHWRDHALCALVGLPSWWWNSSPKDHTPSLEERMAMRVCAACPVRQECLDDVLSASRAWREWSIRGGLLPHQIRRLWRSMKERVA